MTTRDPEFIAATDLLFRLSEAAARIGFTVGDSEAAELYGLLDNIQWELERLEKLGGSR
jgi:hypothetical protein